MSELRSIHRDIRAFYADDASKYEADNNKKLKIRRIYDMIPSNLENKKKRVVFQDIEDKRGKRFSDYGFAAIVGLMISCFSLGFALGRSQKDK